MASRTRVPTVALTATLTSGGAIAVAAGGLWRALALGATTLGLGASLSSVVVSRRALRGVLFVEVPVLLLLASSLVWRIRTTDDIAADPLDAAGAIRVGFVGLAGLLALTALVWPARAETRAGRTPLPFRLYGAYVLVVFAGAPLSVQPLLTAYRGVELATAVLVLLAARQSVGVAAIPRIGSTLYWSLVALVGAARHRRHPVDLQRPHAAQPRHLGALHGHRSGAAARRCDRFAVETLAGHARPGLTAAFSSPALNPVSRTFCRQSARMPAA
jgi:hypothetical protein